MKSKQIMFFTTEKDIEPIMLSIESIYSVEYYEMGLFDDKKDAGFSSIMDIPEFGKPKIGDWNKDLRLLVLPKEQSLQIRQVPQQKGGIKYAIDALINQSSICIQVGGIFKEGILIAGTCGTVYSNDFSDNFFKLISSKIKKNFKKIDGFYVGLDAESKLREGWRLVTNEKLSEGFDLKID